MTERTMPAVWRALPMMTLSAERQIDERRPRPRLRPPSWTALIGLAITAALMLIALVGPMVFDTDPMRQNLLGRLAPPLGLGGSALHPLGTDALGRDILARLLVGARVSLLIGIVATFAAGAIGVTLGLLAGAVGGLIDRLIAWVVDVQMAVPFVVVAIALVAALGAGLATLLLTLALTGWVGYARVVRLQTRTARRAPWVEAARAVGVRPTRLLVRHILPSLSAPIVVLAGQQVAAMILYEAALSYLGLGLSGSIVTWGGMVADGRETLLTAWWVSTLPGIAIALTVLGLNLFGDWLAVRQQPGF